MPLNFVGRLMSQSRCMKPQSYGQSGKKPGWDLNLVALDVFPGNSPLAHLHWVRICSRVRCPQLWGEGEDNHGPSAERGLPAAFFHFRFPCPAPKVLFSRVAFTPPRSENDNRAIAMTSMALDQLAKDHQHGRYSWQ